MASPSAPCKPEEVKRYGKVIILKDECEAKYMELHAGPGVRDLLVKYHLRNFNIFLHRLPDGKLYEFMYCEYHGSDYEGDMALLAAEPRNKEWLDQCNPMQMSLLEAGKGPSSGSGGGWTDMAVAFYNP